MTKITAETKERMRAEMQETIDVCYIVFTPDTLNSAYLWHIWHKAHALIAYTDDHPQFELVGRLPSFPHDFGHRLYPCGASDTHMATAFKAIAPQLVSWSVDRALATS